MRRPEDRRSRREAAAGAVAASILLSALETAVDGATGVQHAVPLVRRSGDGCAGVGRTVFTKNRDRLLADDIPGHRIMPGADKGYDTRDFVAGIRRRGVTPHVAQNTKGRRSAIDRRTPRHRGDAVSVRKRIEEVFGWMKTVGGLRKTRHRGTARVGWMFTLTAAAYNLARMPRLLGAAA